MMTTTKTLLAVSRLLGVSVDEIVKDAALLACVEQFFEEISR